MLEGQDTPLRLAVVAPAGLGVLWIVQLDPVRRSANIALSPELFVQLPTAVQAVGVEHDTPLRELAIAPVGLLGAWTDHAVPFQRAAKVTVVAELFLSLPTAVQAVLERQDTPLRLAVVAPAGLGVLWIVQLVPFHRSASIAVVPEVFVQLPTAVQAVVEKHDTPPTLLAVAPVGLLGAWTDHVVPFQRSANVTGVPELFL